MRSHETAQENAGQQLLQDAEPPPAAAGAEALRGAAKGVRRPQKEGLLLPRPQKEGLLLLPLPVRLPAHWNPQQSQLPLLIHGLCK